MGFVIVMGACCACSNPFSFNPHKVPSVKINGVREPICKPCVEYANTIRAAHGLDLWEVQPDAYEAIPEEEL